MRRWLLRSLWVLLGLSILVPGGIWLLLRGSLPELDGELALPGLSAPVQVQRDGNGMVTVDAADERDMARALGYVHAQERFFEMDLMRRSAAGELSELFGANALPLDRRMRVHRLRTRAHDNLDIALGDRRAVLEAYRDGVNAGLAALPVRPWPYLLLRQRPRAWSLEDSVLAGLAMYADLQDPGNSRELALARIREVVPPALYALLAHDGSSWDAPLFGAARGDAPLPDAATLDLRQLAGRGGGDATAARLARTPAPLRDSGIGGPPVAADSSPGSNNFAVAGALTRDGRAILADDMHLALRAPNLWFRVRLRHPDASAPGGKVDVAGFSLPGLPVVIVGSNTHVAWGFTNSYIDTADFARLPATAPLREYRETIAVTGAPADTLVVRESDWGPVLHENADGSRLALRWTAQLPGAVRLDFADMARAADLDAALAVADRAGIPAQNLLLADRHGRIAWRLAGARPDRSGTCTADGIANMPDAPLPPDTSPFNEPCHPWPLRTDQAPSLVDPANHRLWTANGRVLDGAMLAEAGDGGYDLGARARQVRDGLFAREQFDERDLLAIQLDDRAVLMERWWKLLRATVEHSDDPALRRLEAASRQWDGRAAVDSASYRIARGFRGITLDTLEAGLLAPARQRLGEDFVAPRLPQLEGVAWPLLEQRPPHLLPAPFKRWDELLAHSARQLEADLAAQGHDLAARTWGERNTAAICHPVSRALPALFRRWLCMPAQALPGDGNMPRVQTPDFGASERMVVSPGHEADGIVHMPGGQSGHPLSPFWGAGHDDWVHGRPTPFLPGATTHTLVLRPR
ncbi:MAG: penicillin acylase [Lysobacteraceae bacterium SCN 69-123]|uniref:penicillin acylase family protein n=1 Tax=Stenotrophomonas acidaminiphila TaxID=128780 RepID=UPI000868ABF0|nr:penicillin acylase family protein [Stenotrophomonas acidaminiphila]MDF9442904.1 penicillin acylase family protein [Stenotrophomonas acidaminiphila]ODU41395.1 MAG: penicillin acylase [Xanthomonadaceae bacterium SCN 69-123]OJY76471.1 MAG: penicillin acylase [Stenotrophomonas sp. 69-14]